MFSKIVCGFFGGLLVTLLTAWVLSPVFILFPSIGGAMSSLFFYGIWVLFFVLAFRAEHLSRVWRKVWIFSAFLCFLMPISSLIFAGGLANASSGAGVIGLGAMLGVAGSAFIGSIIIALFGIVFLVIGLLTGRKKNLPSPIVEQA
ncbi:MAG: hypothetical protein ACI9LX_001376 [Paraglaciecola sp.]|jgi:hypothetical protein